MKDGRTLVRSIRHFHHPHSSSSQALTSMNMAVIRSMVGTREVSERKQVGDAESLVHQERSW